MPARRLHPLVILLVASTLTMILALAGTTRAAEDDRIQQRPSLQKVDVDPALIEVGDGDTVVIRWDRNDRERVRLLGIDTPEIAHPGYGMPFDQAFGQQARAFAAGVFAVADRVELTRAAETDPYGRTLGYIFVNGRNYSVLAIAAGLAVETVSHYGDNGLPDEAAAVLAIARATAPAPFEAPYRFRQRMREIEDWHETRADE